MAESRYRTLSRRITPYVGWTTILFLATMFLLYVAEKKQEWALLWPVALFWILFTIYVLLFGLKYEILWNEKEVVMRASGGPKRHIGFDEISQVKTEIAHVSEFLSQSRPFQRIVVYGDKHNLNKRIDISLRHFRHEDIEQLLATIGNHRPDLNLPNNFARMPAR
jgi:hypothetical protein